MNVVHQKKAVPHDFIVDLLPCIVCKLYKPGHFHLLLVVIYNIC